MPAPPRKLNLLQPDRQLFTATDDNVTANQILATHSPAGREFCVKQLLDLVPDMILRASLSIPFPTQGQETPMSVEELARLLDAIDRKMNESNIITRICYEYKCSGVTDLHEETMALCCLLTSYTWDAKVVLALAAFAVTYGEYALLLEYTKANPLAAAISVLNILPQVLENIDLLRQKFPVINDLIKASISVANCMFEFELLPSHYITSETPEMKSAANLIPLAAYWTIRTILVCVRQITSLTGMGHLCDIATTEAWELSTMSHKIDNICQSLRKLLDDCRRQIDEKKYHRTFQTLGQLFRMPQRDNSKILRALIYSKDDQLPLIHCSSNTKANFDVLRKKYVLLLISTLELPAIELSVLYHIYEDSRYNQETTDSDFEVLWLPIVDNSTQWRDEKQTQNLEEILSLMPWFSVSHPSLIDPTAIRYMKEEWHFNKKPLLVVLDPQGKVVNPNAIHMLMIWGAFAHPFTRSREVALWKDESWGLELLVDTIEPLIFTWIEKGKHICLYGGDDMVWIRNFTQKAKEVAAAAKIELEMLYVGKSNPGEKINRNTTTILTENLSHVLPDPALILFFWVRLESMWYSKLQCGKNIENDPILPEITTLLSFDSSDDGWALFSDGSTNIVRSKAGAILRCFIEYDQWKEHMNKGGFMAALRSHFKNLHSPHHCSRLIVSSSDGSVPEKVLCAECGHLMERFDMYQCCN